MYAICVLVRIDKTNEMRLVREHQPLFSSTIENDFDQRFGLGFLQVESEEMSSHYQTRPQQATMYSKRDVHVITESHPSVNHEEMNRCDDDLESYSSLLLSSEHVASHCSTKRRSRKHTLVCALKPSVGLFRSSGDKT
jgi:hypothetical protein